MDSARRLPLKTALALLVLAALLQGCQSAYYKTMETFGIEKREILVDRVDDAREAQQEAKEQFASALDQFMAVTEYRGGELEARYRELKDAYEQSEAKANDVRTQIARVERVADDLFAEWETELGQYSSAQLRAASERQLRDTRASYRQLMTAMRRAESKLDPVLAAFQDRVLFLKHNLNARAIASLRSQRKVIETDIAALVRDMNASIREADRFIENMKGS